MISITVKPLPVPRVTLEITPSSLQVRQRPQVRVPEVVHVDVVPDAGAVAGLVVVSEDHDLLPLAERDLEDQGNQVRLRAMVLPDPACGCCPRRIEVAQGGIAHAVGPGVVPHHVLHVELGAAVGG